MTGLAVPPQPSLFDQHRVGDFGPNPPRSRSGDPSTSTAAAASLNPQQLGLQCQAVLDALRARGCAGGTRDEIADALAWRGDRSVLSRRITDLVQSGLALDIGRTRPGRSGRQQVVWGCRGCCGGVAA